jgi:hypothetical protein
LKKLLIVALLLMSPAAFGAVSITQSAKNWAYDAGTDVTCTLAAPSGASHSLIVGTVRESFGSVHGEDGVVSIADNRGNTYTRATGLGGTRAEIWHSLGATSGVTSLTISFSPRNYFGFGVGYKECFVYEVSGIAALASAAQVYSAGCVASVCTGASVTSGSTTGFVLGIALLDGLDQNCVADPNYLNCGNPNPGNEFVSGSLPGLWGWSGAVSLLSTGASLHAPAWHLENTTVTNFSFSSSTAAYQ